MKAIILAGGRGTRLQSVVSDRPKPMALIEDKPFLHYQIVYLKQNGVQHILLSVGYLKEQIISYFGDLYLGLKIEYVEENEPLGTGGAILNVLQVIKDNDFLVLNGDTFFPVNLSELQKTYNNYKPLALLSLKYMTDIDRYGVVQFDTNFKILKFLEKQDSKDGYINGGVYIFNRKFFNGLIPGKNYSLERILEEQCKSNNIYAFISEAPFIDIGIPEDYYKAKDIISEK